MCKLEPYQQRAIEEKAALDDKIKSLSEFLGFDAFDGLRNADQNQVALMRHQLKYMREYSRVLGNRISFWVN